MTLPQPFKVAIDDAILDDMRNRIRRTRWPIDPGNDDWRYGVRADRLQALAATWADAFDWRAEETAINRYEQFRITLDGQLIHYLRVPGRGPSPMPLILSHGWPWTFWDMRRVLEPLSDPAAHGGDPRDAFELIVPSLPGFGFSTPVANAGMNFWRAADLWHRLMNVLGFARYGAAGGDWGAMISAQLGHKYANALYGVHLAHVLPPNFFNHERPWDVTAGHATPAGSDAFRATWAAFQRRLAAHVAVQVIEPQTLAYAINDSPVGLLAWLLQRWRNWGETIGDDDSALPVDQMLADATLYWATQSFVSSARFYADVMHHPWQPTHDRMPMVEAPTGITFLGGENPPGVSTEDRIDAFKSGKRAAFFNIHHLAAHRTGGHFAHFENPDALVTDIRNTFRALRP